jgi:long-subunit fatty acid transport protein
MNKVKIIHANIEGDDGSKQPVKNHLSKPVEVKLDDLFGSSYSKVNVPKEVSFSVVSGTEDEYDIHFSISRQTENYGSQEVVSVKLTSADLDAIQKLVDQAIESCR